MLDSETAAIIAAASAIAGGAIVAASNYAINRAQARDAHTAQLREALIELYDMLNRIDHRLRVEPQPGPTGRVVAARMPTLGFALGRLARRLLDPQMDELIATMTRSLSRASVIAPPELLPAIATLTEIMGSASEPAELGGGKPRSRAVRDLALRGAPAIRCEQHDREQALEAAAGRIRVHDRQGAASQTRTHAERGGG